MMRKLFLILSIFALVAMGCSNSEADSVENKEIPQNKPTSEPVTLNFVRMSAGLTDQEFANLFKNPLEKKFPNVTLNYTFIQGGPDKLPEFIEGGLKADLIYTNPYGIPIFGDYGYTGDISSLIKSSGMDLNRFDPGILGSIKQYGGANGEIYGIPIYNNTGMLVYNKDLFDKFAIPYPKEMSTWDDIFDLSKKLTRLDGGVHYRGISGIKPWIFGTYTLSMDGKVTINTDQWKDIFSITKSFYDIPGMLDGTNYKQAQNGTGFFLEDRTAAMTAGFSSQLVGDLEELHLKGEKLNWDMTTYPQYKQKPGGMQQDFHSILISKTSEHKELLMEMVKYLASDEIQTEMTKVGRLTVLKDEKIRSNFGSDLQSFKGKNVASALKRGSAPHAFGKDNDTLKGLVDSAFQDVVGGKKDINTALREAQDAGEKALQESKKK